MTFFSRRHFLMGSAVGVGGLLLPLIAQAAEEPLLVVVRNSHPWQDISLDTLRAIFLGEAVRLPDGSNAMPLNDIPGRPARVTFDQKVLQMAPEEVSRYWIDRRIRGQSGAPRSVALAQIRQQLIVRFPEGIAYVAASEKLPEVRALRINGKAAGDKSYALALDTVALLHRDHA